jgi:hypothetical protein
MCYPEAQKLYPSREALWRDHTFEPFLEWVNDKLVKAKWIGLYATENKGCTWGKLLSLTFRGTGRRTMGKALLCRCGRMRWVSLEAVDNMMLLLWDFDLYPEGANRSNLPLVLVKTRYA